MCGCFCKPNDFLVVDCVSLQWRHNRNNGISNHKPHHCLLNRLFRRRSKKTSKLRVTGLCAGNSPVTGEFPAHMASNAEHVSIWWRHYDMWHERYKSICFIPIDLHKVIDIFKRVHWRLWPSPGARPTIGIPIEFEIQWNFAMLLFITYAVDHNEILHTIVTLSPPRWWQLINNVNICF